MQLLTELMKAFDTEYAQPFDHCLFSWMWWMCLTGTTPSLTQLPDHRATSKSGSTIGWCGRTWMVTAWLTDSGAELSRSSSPVRQKANAKKRVTILVWFHFSIYLLFYSVAGEFISEFLWFEHPQGDPFAAAWQEHVIEEDTADTFRLWLYI